MKVQCNNKKCLHRWNYKGTATDDKQYITCPKCHYKSMFGKVRINKTNSHSKYSLTHSLTHSQGIPDIPHNNIEFEQVKFNDGLYYSVEKSMAQKFKEIDVPEFKKIIESPQTDFIEGTPTLTYSDDPIPRNFCEKHKLPATYDSYFKKWICNECSEELILAQ